VTPRSADKRPIDSSLNDNSEWDESVLPESSFPIRYFLSYSRYNVARHSSNTISQSPWKLLLALLCISLVIACGTIQAIHVHPDGDLSHSDCPLCATAHVAVQVVEPPVALHVAPIVSTVEPFVPAVPSQTLKTFALFTRPPPADALSA
jgi:hypothetical protein